MRWHCSANMSVQCSVHSCFVFLYFFHLRSFSLFAKRCIIFVLDSPFTFFCSEPLFLLPCAVHCVARQLRASCEFGRRRTYIYNCVGRVEHNIQFIYHIIYKMHARHVFRFQPTAKRWWLSGARCPIQTPHCSIA